eukprot:SAG31_NODE_10343_length_1152_cov_1.486230_2_plen_142_part_00
MRGAEHSLLIAIVAVASQAMGGSVPPTSAQLQSMKLSELMTLLEAHGALKHEIEGAFDAASPKHAALELAARYVPQERSLQGGHESRRSIATSTNEGATALSVDQWEFDDILGGQVGINWDQLGSIGINWDQLGLIRINSD